MRSMHPVLKIAVVVTTVQSAAVCNNGCSSHGVCNQGTCHCELDWTGVDCSFFLASTSTDDDSMLTPGLVSNCIDGCSGHGSCLGDVCFCSDGWGGASCAAETTCLTGCGNGGTCHSGACVCKKGFFGATCEDQSCPNDCFGHGSCNHGQCRCGSGWSGTFCGLQLDSQVLCDPACQGGASCVNGQCYCPQGFYGTDCSIPVSNTAKKEVNKELIPVSNTAKKEVNKESNAKSGPSMMSLARTVLPLLWPVSQNMDANLEKTSGLRGHSTSDKTSAFATVAPSAQKFAPVVSQLQIHPQTTEVSPTNSQLSASQVSTKVPDISSGASQDSPTDPQLMQRLEKVAEESPADSPLFTKLEKVAKLAGDSATQLWRQAQMERFTRAKDRIQRAISLAHEHAEELPGHEFRHHKNKTQKAQSNVALISLEEKIENVTKELTNSSKRKLSEDDSPETLLKGSAQEALGMARKMAKRIADNYASTNCDGGCNGHGVCGPNKMCLCEDKWFGDVCDSPRCENDCGGRGVCIKEKCICEKGFFGKICQHQRCPDDCSGNGYCLQGSCECLGSATGPNCAVVPEGIEVGPVSLAVQGSDTKGGSSKVQTLRAIVPNGVRFTTVVQRVKPPPPPAPAPPPPAPPVEGPPPTPAPMPSIKQIPVFFHSNHPGIQPANCAPGYGGTDCQMPLLCSDSTCSGHGQCVQGRCQCGNGFGGDLCSHQLGTCAQDCGGNGFCNERTAMCECRTGWTGPVCEMSATRCPHSCSGHGACLNNQCVCMDSWTGPICNMVLERPGTVMDVSPVQAMSMHPLAMIAKSIAEDRGRSGTCQSNKDCKTRGICLTGKCLCLRGWNGADCSQESPSTQNGAGDTIPITVSGGQPRHKEVHVTNFVETTSTGHKHKEVKTLNLDDILFQLQANLSTNLHKEAGSLPVASSSVSPPTPWLAALGAKEVVEPSPPSEEDRSR